jgi:hypothetical protein
MNVFIYSKSQSMVKSSLRMPILMTLMLFLALSTTPIMARAKNTPPQYFTLNQPKIGRNVLQNTDSLPIYTIVEEQPEFVGGQKAMYQFLGQNIKYPEYSREHGHQGTVYVGFVIEIDGSISNITCKRAPQIVDSVKTHKEDGSVLEVIVFKKDAEFLVEESIRVIAAMPRWIPGRQKGVAVRTAYTLPIKFRSCG